MALLKNIAIKKLSWRQLIILGGRFSSKKRLNFILKSNLWSQSALTKKSKHASFFQSKKYIDTRGNARHLREWLSLRDMWPYQPIILISAKHHARRAALCFRKEGFKIAQIVSVPYAIKHDEFIVPRLWYYKHPNLHILYELLAFIYDFLRPSNTKLSQG